MQRLRYVRQLGVGHVLFPTSGYSRFEHSIGVLHTATRMFQSIVDGQVASGRQTYMPLEFEKRKRLVRLAALLHDAGHCVLSHVSEQFYARYGPLEDAKEHYSAYYGDVSLSASETVTLLILQSPGFLRLLRESKCSRDIGLDEDEILGRICACIAGSKRHMKPDAFLAAIVNGSVDADKLDYLVRDAHMAGVPISLDISRLFSKLRLAEMDRDEDGVALYSLAIVPSGTRALDELLVSRIFLYDKFYYHPKVMAAEEVVRRALYHLSRVAPEFRNPVTLLKYGDDEFLSLTPEQIAAATGTRADSDDLRRGCELLRRVKYRDLPKRAFAFALRYAPAPTPLAVRFESENGVVPSDDAATTSSIEFRQISRALNTAAGRERFASEIEDCARELGVNVDVFVAFQQAKRAANGVYLPALLPNGRVEERPTFLFKSHEWTEAYALNKATSYVFAYDSLPTVHVAAERLFAERHQGLSFAPNCWIMAKVDGAEVEKVRATLSGDWLPYRLAPNVLRTTPYSERIRKQRERFASFLNPMSGDGTHLVETWLNQFPDADLRDSALRLLEQTTYVEPNEIRAAVQRHLAKDPTLQDALWIPVVKRGEVTKSANQLMVDLKASKLIFRPMRNEFSAAEIRRAGQVVFFDDSLNSGTQLACLLGSWFGNESICSHKSDGDPEGALPADVQDALRSVSVSFCYYSTHPMGEERLADTCRTLGVRLGKIYKTLDASDPRHRLTGVSCASQASKQRLRDFLQQRGEALLRQKIDAAAPGWDEQRVKESALGYSGLELTLLYRHSISASAPVAMWSMASGPDDYWIPLFPRKPEELVARLGEEPGRPATEVSDSQLEEYEGR
ncbi:MAG: HD domain-containing protein [Acidobacteria bacterium]|nr:HD domain-containing protein [Acidobacteriota bacterium]